MFISLYTFMAVTQLIPPFLFCFPFPLFPALRLSVSVCVGVGVAIPSSLSWLLDLWLPAHLPPISSSALQYIYPGSSLILHQIVVSTTVVLSRLQPTWMQYSKIQYPCVFCTCTHLVTLSPRTSTLLPTCLPSCLPAYSCSPSASLAHTHASLSPLHSPAKPSSISTLHPVSICNKPLFLITALVSVSCSWILPVNLTIFSLRRVSSCGAGCRFKHPRLWMTLFILCLTVTDVYSS